MAKLTQMFPLLALIVGVVLPVLPAEGATITDGTATGLATPHKAGVTVIGFDTIDPSNDPFFPCRSMAVIFAVINTEAAPHRGSDVFGANDGMVLPLKNLKSNPGQTCLYEETFDPPGPLGPRKVRLLLGRNDGFFNFRLEYRGGTYVTGDTTPPTPPTPTTPCLQVDPLNLYFEVRLAGGPSITDNVVWTETSRLGTCNNLQYQD